jgi:hypothetical protein
MQCLPMDSILRADTKANAMLQPVFSHVLGDGHEWVYDTFNQGSGLYSGLNYIAQPLWR